MSSVHESSNGRGKGASSCHELCTWSMLHSLGDTSRDGSSLEGPVDINFIRFIRLHVMHVRPHSLVSFIHWCTGQIFMNNLSVSGTIPGTDRKTTNKTDHAAAHTELHFASRRQTVSKSINQEDDFE